MMVAFLKKSMKIIGVIGILAVIIGSVFFYQAQAYASEEKLLDTRNVESEEITEDIIIEETQLQEETTLNETTSTQLQTEPTTIQDTQQTTTQSQTTHTIQQQSSQLSQEISNAPVGGIPLTDAQGKLIASQNASKFASQVYAVVELTNQYRAQFGQAPLQIDSTLTQAAMLRAAEMAHMENGSSQVSHTRPNGLSFSSVVNIYGIACNTIGENILDVYDTPQSAVDAWYNSQTHRENILGNYTNIGIGVAVAENGIYYWVQLFTN